LSKLNAKGMEWIRITQQDDVPAAPFFLSDEFENVYVGFNAFDYFDASYWFPIPKYPFPGCIITNDLCISSLLKDLKI
jgi:hypothetical protein